MPSGASWLRLLQTSGVWALLPLPSVTSLQLFLQTLEDDSIGLVAGKRGCRKHRGPKRGANAPQETRAASHRTAFTGKYVVDLAGISPA
jgi:hypothetical protein